jgi:glycerol uptake facilitator-like aquaporin
MEEAKDSIKDLLRRGTTEFIGTFLFVLSISLTTLQPNEVLQAFVPGLTLMAMIFAAGHISLGSFNPR